MGDNSETPLRVIRLQADNIKRLRAVDIVPRGDVVHIRGRNGQGKSSVLDSIAMAIGGTKLCPPEPIHRGESRASVSVDLGALRVTRVFTDGGASRIEVTDADGVKRRSPQAVLSELTGGLSFDPLEFLRLGPKDKRAKLLAIAGIEKLTAEVEATAARLNARISEARSAATFAASQIQAAAPIKPGTPAEPIDSADIVAELRAAREAWDDFKTRERRYVESEGALSAVEAMLETAKLRRVELAAELARVDDKIRTCGEHVAETKAARTAAADVVSAMRESLPDIAAIEAKFSDAAAINAEVARAKVLADHRARIAAGEREASEARQQIEAERGKLKTALEMAALPVAGLGFTDDGVTFSGLPIEQAAQSEQLRTAIAIAMADNPRLRVILVRDGSLLDSGGMAILAEMAADRGYQVWVESVDESGRVGVVIEDGAVVADHQ